MPTPLSDQAASALEALKRAVDFKGGQKPLASAIGYSQPSVWRWLNGTQIPAEAAIAIEKSTGVPKEEIRPDLFVAEPTTSADPRTEDTAA